MNRPLPGFEEEGFRYLGADWPLYVRGKGPGIVIMHEVPGIYPEVVEFATKVADAGFTVFMPSLFGTPGKPFSATYAATQIARACIRREFAAFEANNSGPIADMLRQLCRYAHERCGGAGVGALGMCFTGNFALALAVEPCVLAPVLSQPSLPIGGTAEARAGLHLSPAELETVKLRVQQEDLKVLGLRFSHDLMCPKAKFERLQQELGEGFEGIEINSEPFNPHGLPLSAHSVLTRHLVDEAGHPTRQALERVIAFFKERLQSAPA